jgi:hypothetical protein
MKREPVVRRRGKRARKRVGSQCAARPGNEHEETDEMAGDG